MKVSIYSSYFNSIKDDFKKYVSSDLKNILLNSDIISFHCKPNKDGSSIITKDNFNMMKKNCILVNTARGGLINEADLLKHLKIIY